MAVMAREAWTDERLDDLKEQMNNGFGEVKGEIRELRVEINSIRTEINHRFEKLNYTLIAALVGLVATHYLG
jgi:hypothetical protein